MIKALAHISLNQTLNFEVTDEKPLKSNKIKQKKVDINVLKARAQEHKTRKIENVLFLFSFNNSWGRRNYLSI